MIWAIWLGILAVAFSVGVAIGWGISGPDKWTPKPPSKKPLDITKKL